MYIHVLYTKDVFYVLEGIKCHTCITGVNVSIQTPVDKTFIEFNLSFGWSVEYRVISNSCLKNFKCITIHKCKRNPSIEAHSYSAYIIDSQHKDLNSFIA